MADKIELLRIGEETEGITMMYSYFCEDDGYSSDAFVIARNGLFIGVIDGFWEVDKDDDINHYFLDYIEILNQHDRGKGYGTRAFELLKEKFGIKSMGGSLTNIAYCGEGSNNFIGLIEKFGATITREFDDDDMKYVWRGEGTVFDYIEENFYINF